MEKSKIEWTGNTFNPWWGCRRVSPACLHCYAESTAARYGHAVWGKSAPRRQLSDVNWAQPLRWNAAAQAAGERTRVFSGSMCDVFENRRDLDASRARLWSLIEATLHLDWQLLTKRPQHVAGMVPWGQRWPRSVWIGCTVENQRAAALRLPQLTALPACVRFISAEPLLGALDLSPWLAELKWVVTGGETGGGARPSSPSWFTALRDQCVAAGVGFFFKQWGDHVPVTATSDMPRRALLAADGTPMLRVSKAIAGRLLNGRTWDEPPSRLRR